VKVRAAVLERVGADRPYAASRPLGVEEVDLDEPEAGELLVRLVGSYMGSSAPQRDVPRFVDLWRAGRLPVERLHSATVGLDDVNEAMDALAEGIVVRQIVLPS